MSPSPIQAPGMPQAPDMQKIIQSIQATQQQQMAQAQTQAPQQSVMQAAQAAQAPAAAQTAPDEKQGFLASRGGLGELFKSLAGAAVGGFNSAVNPRMYAEQQESKRQKDAQEVQENGRKQQQDFEQAHWKQTQDAQDAHNEFLRRMQMQEKVASGAFKEVDPSTPNALVVGTGKNAYAVRPNLDVTPDAGYTIEANSPEGRFYNLSSGQKITGLKPNEYLHFKETARSQMEKEAAVAGNTENLASMVKRGHASIAARFAPGFYEGSYGKGHVDPEISTWKTMFDDDLDNAGRIDRKTGSTSETHSVLKSIHDWHSKWENDFSEERRHSIDAGAAIQAHLAQFPDPSPDETKQYADSVIQSNQHLDQMGKITRMNPKLGHAVEAELAKRRDSNGKPLTLVNLDNQERDMQNVAKIGQGKIQEIRNIMSQPGMQEAFGAATSRWQDFQNGTIGAGADRRWKAVADRTSMLKGIIGKIHYSARGSANENVQKIWSKIISAEKMDYPTFMQGLDDMQSLTDSYARIGVPDSVQGQLNLGGAPAQGFLPAHK